MPEIRIGEKMSEITDTRGLITNSYGDLYNDQIALRLDRPLTMPQLLYAKMRLALPDDIAIEVWWDHFKDLTTVVLAGRGIESEISFGSPQVTRWDLVKYIDQFVERIREAIPSQE
jgi:hypothetical protein